MPGKQRTYYTHHNGGRPYKVVIEDHDVRVYRQIDETEDWESIYEQDSYLTEQPKRAFVGKSNPTKMTEFSGGHGTRFHGSSILLEYDDGHCLFIGDKILSFTPLAEIERFVSPVGNSDVPYPYAVDKEENYYLLIENVVVKGVPKNIDPYNYYYQRALMTTDLGRIPPKEPVIKNFAKIESFFIDDDQYTMTYKPRPEHDYDRLTSPDWGEKMFIVDCDGGKHQLNKDDYVKIMTDYGILMGFSPLPDSNTIHEPDF